MKLGLGQLLVEGGEPERNFERALKMIKKSSQSNYDIILFPETIDFAWTHPSSIHESEPIPRAYSDMFCQWAKEFRYICRPYREGGRSAL